MVSYSPEFDQQDLVRSVIRDWNTERPSFTLYSSGTQGSSKGVELNHNLLKWSAENTANTFELKNENSYCCLPVNKTGGFMMIIRALHLNWDIYLEAASSSPFQKLETSHHYTLTSLSPMQCSKALTDSPKQLACFKTVLIGGAELDPVLEESLIDFEERNTTRFIITYGMTETASHIAYRKPGDEGYQLMAGVYAELNDSKLLIHIKDLDLHIQTEDFAEVTEHGFKITGRADDVINSGGLKIFPSEIEPMIREVLDESGIKRAFYLSSMPHQTLGNECILIIEGEQMKDSAFLLESLKRILPKNQSPKKIIYKQPFRYTDTGKLRRLKANEY